MPEQNCKHCGSAIVQTGVGKVKGKSLQARKNQIEVLDAIIKSMTKYQAKLVESIDDEDN